MENIYGVTTYLVCIIALFGTVLMVVNNILKERRFKKYYKTIKEDSAFWQMKIEQTLGNIDRYNGKIFELEQKNHDLQNEKYYLLVKNSILGREDYDLEPEEDI